MILINLETPSLHVVFETTFVVEDSEFILKFSSDSTQESHQIALIGNLSNSIERYFHFQLQTELFQQFQTGFYSYSITLNDESTVVTAGKLYIKAIEENDVITFPSEQDDEGYITFNG